jgi:hypothetical protein
VTRGNDRNKLCFIGADITALRASSCADGAGYVGAWQPVYRNLLQVEVQLYFNLPQKLAVSRT